jgi:hypothetical protein
MNRHSETLTFNSFSGYYGSVPAGYGGFDWTDIDYFNPGNDGGSGAGDPGFANAIRGRGEAGFGMDGGGAFESVNLLETFSLKSMLVASGAGTGDPVMFSSYTYQGGKLTLKARDVVYVTPQVQKIDFAKIGGTGDFQNIAAVSMVVGSARYASHYGHDLIGDGMVFDNMKVQWNGRIPDGNLVPAHRHELPPHVAHELTVSSNAGATHADGSEPARTDYHSAVTSLDQILGHAAGHGGLTGQFVLPAPDHFGT